MRQLKLAHKNANPSYREINLTKMNKHSHLEFAIFYNSQKGSIAKKDLKIRGLLIFFI